MAFSSAVASYGHAPNVTFEYRPEEDREASIAAGRLQVRDVAYAIVRPHNSNQVLEHRAEDWVVGLAERARDARYPQEWADGFAEYFRDWKRRNAIPPEGFAVRYWAAVDRSTAEMLIDADLITVEQLADAPDGAIEHVKDGSALRDRARAWLESANNAGKLAEQCAAQQAEIGNLKARVAELQANIADLQSMLDRATDPKAVKSIRRA